MYIDPQVTIRDWVALAITKVYQFLFLIAAAFILLTLAFRSRHGSFSSASWHLAAGSRYHTPVRKHPATENRWCCVSEGRFRDMWCMCFSRKFGWVDFTGFLFAVGHECIFQGVFCGLQPRFSWCDLCVYIYINMIKYVYDCWITLIP